MLEDHLLVGLMHEPFVLVTRCEQHKIISMRIGFSLGLRLEEQTRTALSSCQSAMIYEHSTVEVVEASGCVLSAIHGLKQECTHARLCVLRAEIYIQVVPPGLAVKVRPLHIDNHNDIRFVSVLVVVLSRTNSDEDPQAFIWWSC